MDSLVTSDETLYEHRDWYSHTYTYRQYSMFHASFSLQFSVIQIQWEIQFHQSENRHTSKKKKKERKNVVSFAAYFWFIFCCVHVLCFWLWTWSDWKDCNHFGYFVCNSHRDSDRWCFNYTGKLILWPLLYSFLSLLLPSSITISQPEWIHVSSISNYTVRKSWLDLIEIKNQRQLNVIVCDDSGDGGGGGRQMCFN